MPATDDEIREKYLERAIRELNQLTHELQECPHCPRGKLMPVLGSGHPAGRRLHGQARPGVAEIEEGVAFYGRAGNALMKSFKRLGIDPLVVYGTLCVKCPIAEPDLAAEECVRRLVEELAIVQPKIVVVMGEPALRVLNGLEVPLARPIEPREGEIQAFTPTVDALYTPDIDESLDEEGAKQALLAGLQDARRVVRGPAAVLRRPGICRARFPDSPGRVRAFSCPEGRKLIGLRGFTIEGVDRPMRCSVKPSGPRLGAAALSVPVDLDAAGIRRGGREAARGAAQVRAGRGRAPSPASIFERQRAQAAVLRVNAGVKTNCQRSSDGTIHGNHTDLATPRPPNRNRRRF